MKCTSCSVAVLITYTPVQHAKNRVLASGRSFIQQCHFLCVVFFFFLQQPCLFLAVILALQVKSVSHDLEQLNRLLHMVRSLVQNPYLYLGSYVRSLVSSVMYCILEPLAASINPLNDHWTLRDYAALLLSHIFW